MIGRPARWGTDDCLCAAASVSAIIVGRDPIAGVRGRWTDEASARKFEASLGRDRREAARELGRQLGHSEIRPADAKPGDLGLIKVREMVVTGCKLPGGGWFVRANKGFLVKREAVIAWSV